MGSIKKKDRGWSLKKSGRVAKKEEGGSRKKKKKSISANGFAFKNFKATTIFPFLWVRFVVAREPALFLHPPKKL